MQALNAEHSSKQTGFGETAINPAANVYFSQQTPQKSKFIY